MDEALRKNMLLAAEEAASHFAEINREMDPALDEHIIAVSRLIFLIGFKSGAYWQQTGNVPGYEIGPEIILN